MNSNIHVYYEDLLLETLKIRIRNVAYASTVVLSFRECRSVYMNIGEFSHQVWVGGLLLRHRSSQEVETNFCSVATHVTYLDP
jgi:hypothetical protein